MKKVFILFLLISSFSIQAQQPPKMIKYNAKNVAGIFYYNLDEAVKKIKVKKEKVKFSTRKALRAYNDKIKDISFLNSVKLSTLETTINTLGDQLRQNRDLALRVRKQIDSTILPIRDSIKKYEDTLNTKLESILNSKQYKKWLKYQKKEKRKLLPKMPSRAPQRSRMRGNRMGGRRF